MMRVDTRDTKQAGEQVERTSTMEYAALASIFDGVIISNIEGRVTLLNRAAARMLRVDPQAAMGQPVRALLEPFSARGRLTIIEAMNRLCADPYSYGQSGEMAETIIESDMRFIQAHLAPVLTDVGEFLGIVTVLRDITREVEAERARSDFVSNVSHELRLPLTAIKGYCDLLLHDAIEQLDGEHQRFLQIVQSNADHLVALINDLLDISHIESYRMELDIQPIQMDRIIRDVADMIRPQCNQKDLHLTVEIDPNVGTVLGDRKRLKQVITNLANNACRSTPEGGHITLTLSRSDNGVQVDVTDTGASIPPDDRARIFQRFHRMDGTTSHETWGTGLELPVAKMLAEMHGGRLWVESKPGQGNTFTFILPQYAERPGDGSAKATEHSERQYTILVVEDDEDIAQLIVLQLRREGFQVLTTPFGEEAVSLARTQDVDLITLDMMLPDITGMEVLHQLKSNPETADIPVIIVSVLLPEQTGDAGQEAVEYITKPFAFDKLMESIRRTLQTSRRARRTRAGIVG